MNVVGFGERHVAGGARGLYVSRKIKHDVLLFCVALRERGKREQEEH